MSGIEIVLHSQNRKDGSPLTALGLQLAAHLKAHLLGLHVIPFAPSAFVSPEAVALQIQETDKLVKEALKREPWWHSQLQTHGVSGEWQVVQGDTVEVLCYAARWCDLVVIERPTLNPEAPTGWGIASRAVFGATTPVIVVPETTKVNGVGKRIVIAWNGSPEATLAIRGALPLLKQATQITVLEGQPTADPFRLRYLPKLNLREWLARHHVQADFQAFTPEKDQGASLLDAAHQMNADLIVMGAWGHSRITELVLGGMTRYLFQNSDLPLLVAH